MGTPADLEEVTPAGGNATQQKNTTIRIGKAFSVVFVMNVAVRLLTLVSQVMIAALFGTSNETDAYVLALIVPTTIAGVLSVAVGAAIIPIYIEYRENRTEAEATHILWTATTLGTLLILVLTLVMMAGSPVLIALFAHQTNPATQALAASLLRFLIPIILLQSLITLFGALLNTYGRFVESSLLPAANAICIVLFLVLFHHVWGIYALGWGTLAGYTLNLLLLLMACLRLGVRLHFSVDWRHPGLRRIAVIVTPALLGSMLVNVNILVDQFMTGFLPTGNISSLNYAVKLVDTPSQFFYTALYTALLPVFSTQAARRDFDALRGSFRQLVILFAIILLPAGALLSVLSRPLVVLFYQHGKFTGTSTDLVTSAMIFLAPSMFLVTYGFINARAYQALQDNWTLCSVGVLSLTLNGVLDYLLMQVWGVAGITFSTTLTYLISAVVLLCLLERKLHGLHLPQIGLAVGKAGVAAALMWLVCWFLGKAPFIEHIPPLLQICVLAVVGVVIYIPLLWGLRLRELRDLWGMLRSRLPIGRSGASTA